MPDLKCADCGKPLPSGMPDGMCPKCLLILAVPAPPTGQITEESLKRLRYFGDYELMEEVARGGMGVVWKARQVTLNRLVAVKLLMPGFADTEERVRRFRTEAEAIASLDHPNIVAIHEVGEHHGQHYFSMEFVPGGDLARRVARQPLSPREAAECVAQVAAAIHHAHQRGVLHRDLKPANVLIGPNQEPRVTDFGLAKLFRENRDLTATGKIMGTPSFMSPEQLDPRRGETTTASDVYGLGAILYYLLTGQPPFTATTLESAMLAILNEEPLPPRRMNAAVPRDLETVCLKCLAKEPARRYGSAAEVAAELERFLNHEPLVARRVSATERAWLWTRRNPVVAGLTAALVTTLSIAVAVLGQSLADARHARDATEGKVRFILERHLPQLEVIGRSSLVGEVLEEHRPYFEEQSRRRSDREFHLFHAAFALADARHEKLTGRFVEAKEKGERSLALLTRVSNDLSGSKGTNQMLAHSFLRDLYKDSRDPGDSNADAAVFRKNRGGNSRGAIEHGKAAVMIGEHLLAQEPKNNGLKALLASAHLGLGVVGWEFDLLDVEQKAFESAAQLATQLVAQPNTLPEWVHIKAQSHYHLGRMSAHTADWKQALVQYREYLRLMESLVAAHRENPELQSDRAAAYARVAEALCELSRDSVLASAAEKSQLKAEALANARASLRDREALDLRDPGNVNWQKAYGRLLSWMAWQFRTNASEQALTENRFQKSAEIFTRLVQRESQRDDWADELGAVLPAYAGWNFEIGRRGKSDELLQLNITNQIAALAASPERPSHHRRLALAYRALGRSIRKHGDAEMETALYQAAIATLPSTNGAWRWSLAGMRANVARSMQYAGQTNLAISEIQTSLDLRLTLHKESPDEVRLWKPVIDTFYFLGTTQAAEGRLDDASATTRQLLKWATANPNVLGSSWELRKTAAEMVSTTALAAAKEVPRRAEAANWVEQGLVQWFSEPPLNEKDRKAGDRLRELHRTLQEPTPQAAPAPPP